LVSDSAEQSERFRVPGVFPQEFLQYALRSRQLASREQTARRDHGGWQALECFPMAYGDLRPGCVTHCTVQPLELDPTVQQCRIDADTAFQCFNQLHEMFMGLQLRTH
jgi:hypothetical protein